MKLSGSSSKHDTDNKEEDDDNDNLNLKEVAKQGQLLQDIKTEIENEINQSLDRINHYQIGYETQLNKWNKLSENQQSLSVVTIQLKNVQTIWKLQLKINLQINKLSKSFGFNNNEINQIRNDNDDNDDNDKMIELCIKIINDIHLMIEKSDKCIIQIQMTQKQKKNNMSYDKNKSSLNDIVNELHDEVTLYSSFIVEIFEFAFNSIVNINNLEIKIKSIYNLSKILNCIDFKLNMKTCIMFIHSRICLNIFNVIFDSSLLFKLKIKEQKEENKNKSIIINKITNINNNNDKTKNLLCLNVCNFIKIIEWIEINIFINNKKICKFWKEYHLFPSMDDWIILWINLNTPILSSLLFTPKFNDDDDNNDKMFDKIQDSAIQHITRSIAYQENIENALKSLEKIINDTKINSSKKYLAKSLELLENNDNDENQYGLSSKILSKILPSKIRQFIFESIREKIKNHGYEPFNPLNLQKFRKIIIDNNDDDINDEKKEESNNKDNNNNNNNNNKMIKYIDLIKQSELFFLKKQCKISTTMFEIVIIIYNICIFIEEMYYIDNNDNDILNLATMYVDLFMNICRNIIELWMSLSISYHKKYFYDVSSLGFQFYNDCSFLSFNLLKLSIKTNHGNLLITDNIKNNLIISDTINLKYIWFTDYIQLLKSLGKQYFIYHLHKQRITILKSLSNINKFNGIDNRKIFENLKQNFSESLISIAQFLKGSRSIIPDNLLYQIGEKLLKCICNCVINEILKRINDSDIGVNAAHNISLIIKHIETFEILINDMQYLTKNISKIWKKFIKISDILDKDASLLSLTKELNNGELDVFNKKILIQLICALFDESDKRSKFIQAVDLR